MNSLSNPQNDYSAKVQNVKPSYHYSKTTPQTGGLTVDINTGNPETIFELPPRVMNFNRSKVKFNLFVDGKATFFNHLFNDTACGIDELSLYTRGGVQIATIAGASQYSKIALKTIPTDELSYASKKTSITPGSKSAAAVDANFRPDGTVSNAYNEPKYIVTPGVIDAGADEGDILVGYDIPLSIFKDSIFGIDKDLYFNEVILLKIKWSNRTKWGVRSTSATNATASGQNYDTDLDISSLYLYLALESNQFIASQLMQKVNSSGMTISIPYIHTFRLSPGSAGAGGVQTVRIRLNASMGQYVKRIYHSMHVSNELTVNTQFSLDNTNKTNFRYYFTRVNNVRRQEHNIVTADNDDWDQVRYILKDTPIDCIDAYRYNWFIVDDFDIIDGHLFGGSEGVATGLPLATEQTWESNVSCENVAYNHYIFAVTTRELHVTPQGIMVQ